MQEARYRCELLSSAVLITLGGWLLTNVDSKSTQPPFTPGTKPPPLPAHLAETRRIIASGLPISYRLDSWSQYENPEEGKKREGDIHGPLSRKTITTDKRLLWPDGIVKYYIDSSLVEESSKLAILHSAMDIIMSKTCVKFVRIFPDENDKLPSDGWVNITGSESGCYSDLGRSPYGPSRVNLNVNKCFRMIGHAIHEMLHTLGAYHEHMRPDRDAYINIVWENIRPGNAYNFRILHKSVVTDYGLPYDYDSIMHYSMTAFSINKMMPTIIPKDSHAVIGQRAHLSHYDIQKLLITYNCSNAGVASDQTTSDQRRKYRLLKQPKKNDTKQPKKHDVEKPRKHEVKEPKKHEIKEPEKHEIKEPKRNVPFEKEKKIEVELTVQSSEEDKTYSNLMLPSEKQVIVIEHKCYLPPYYHYFASQMYLPMKQHIYVHLPDK